MRGNAVEDLHIDGLIGSDVGVEDASPGADDGLARTSGIADEADARSEVVVVAALWSEQAVIEFEAGSEGADVIVVAHTQVQGKTAEDLPVACTQKPI